MKDYYQIMGVDRKATAKEIKRTFRQLAIKYHPDKNPSQDAEERFKDINEAYEVLSDPAAREEYDMRLDSPLSYTQSSPVTTRRDPYYHRTGARRPTGPTERMVFMQSVHRYSQLLFFFGCFWSVLLVVDYLMPADVTEEVVITDLATVQRIVLGSMTATNGDLLVTEAGHHFPVQIHELKHFPKQSVIRIYRSNLLSAIIKLENHNGTFEVNNLASIYRNLSFAPIMLLLCCAAGLIFRKGVEFHINLGIVVFLLMVLNIFFLFNSRI